MEQLSDQNLNNRPFNYLTTFDHFNTRLVRYSDPHCSGTIKTQTFTKKTGTNSVIHKCCLTGTPVNWKKNSGDPKTESIQISNITVIWIPIVCFPFYRTCKIINFLVHHSFFNKFKVEGHELGDEGLDVVDGLAPLRQPMLILKRKYKFYLKQKK